MQTILEHPEYTYQCVWNWESLSRNPSITLDDVVAHPEYMTKWSWEGLSLNPSINLKFMLHNPECPWNWHNVSANPSISFADVLEHPEIEWNWNMLSINPSIKWKDVLEHPDYEWNWYNLSSKPFMPFLHKEIQDELKATAIKRQYMPNSYRYCEARVNFELSSGAIPKFKTEGYRTAMIDHYFLLTSGTFSTF